MSSLAKVFDALGAAVDTAAALPVPDLLQAQIGHLQKLVSTLMQKMQDEEDAFDSERISWEAGEEHHDEEEPATPLRTATAPTTPVRPAQAEHFNVTPAGADTEWGGSRAPAGMAAAPGWSAPGWAANAGWWPSGGIQDPWTQSADPWASWNSGWHHPIWRGWWGDAAPPSHPPGVPIAAAPEQGTGCADAYDGWRYGGWNWPANS